MDPSANSVSRTCSNDMIEKGFDSSLCCTSCFTNATIDSILWGSMFTFLSVVVMNDDDVISLTIAPSIPDVLGLIMCLSGNVEITRLSLFLNPADPSDGFGRVDTTKFSLLLNPVERSSGFCGGNDDSEGDDPDDPDDSEGGGDDPGCDDPDDSEGGDDDSEADGGLMVLLGGVHNAKSSNACGSSGVSLGIRGIFDGLCGGDSSSAGIAGG